MAIVLIIYLIGVFTGGVSVLIAVKQFQEKPPTSGR